MCIRIRWLHWNACPYVILAPQVPYTFYVKDMEVMESLEQTVSELGAYHCA